MKGIHKHIHMGFNKNGVLCLTPKTDLGMMVLRQYDTELDEHGAKMIHVETELPIQLGQDKSQKE